MRILVVGAGGVGSAIASIAARRNFFEELIVADIDRERADRAAHRANRQPGAAGRVASARVDAADHVDVAELARQVRADVVVNACEPRFNPPIFDAAFAVGAHYIDMAMHMSAPHPDRPYEECGVRLGDAQFAVSAEWAERGQLALVGMGVEPGLSDVFARYAADHLFQRVAEVGVRDGSDLRIAGYQFAPTFSIWTTIEECLNPPIIYERERGWFTTEPFSGREQFRFPEGIGELTCVNVEHEEVLLVPRYLDVDRVTFKYGLGDEFIEVLQTLHRLGLAATRPVNVRGQVVSPRDVVAACLPNPAELGEVMTGRTCAGTWVTGTGLDGQPREVYLYHLVENAWSMREYGHQAVVWQTAVNPVVALELLACGAWSGAGVMGPEAFDSLPYLGALRDHGVGWQVEERTPSLV